ncbi:MAG: hypothetical protein CR971_01860 [candidate division SR1 bacterium]|nr:MAG: hypothetical protein CR971_01860 [candidate division SR1 bacterium]
MSKVKGLTALFILGISLFFLSACNIQKNNTEEWESKLEVKLENKLEGKVKELENKTEELENKLENKLEELEERREKIEIPENNVEKRNIISINPELQNKFTEICKNKRDRKGEIEYPSIKEYIKKNNTIFYTQYYPNIEARCMDSILFTGWSIFSYSCKDNMILEEIFNGDNDTQKLRDKNNGYIYNMGCGANVVDANEKYIVLSGLPYEGKYCGNQENYYLFDKNQQKLSPLSIFGEEIGQGVDKPSLFITGFKNSEIIKKQIEENAIKKFGKNIIEETGMGCLLYHIKFKTIDMDFGNGEFSATIYTETGQQEQTFTGNIYKKILGTKVTVQ